MSPVSISFDDIDSKIGGCTTHFTTIFLHMILDKVEYLLDYPLLVRLNPNIPWKTRGNASTALRLHTRLPPGELLEIAVQAVEEYTRGRPQMHGKRPGVVVVEGEPWRSPLLRSIYKRAVTEVLDFPQVERALRSSNALYWGGRGVIGAAAALAALAPGDPYTFEAVAYRHPGLWGEDRCVNPGYSEGDSPSCTFNNYDYTLGVPSAAPGGYDPVLAGVRGSCPAPRVLDNIRCEDIHLCMVFRSNQHTDPHSTPLTPRFTPYSVGTVVAEISGEPIKLPKGHTVAEALVYGSSVDLVAFRETWPINRILSSLEPGDRVEALVHVKPYTVRGRKVLAVEKLRILELYQEYHVANPRCPLCGSTMKSMGRLGGFKCSRCGYKTRTYRKATLYIGRELSGGYYTVKPGRYPHLSSPPIFKPPVLGGLVPIDPARILCKPGS